MRADGHTEVGGMTSVSLSTSNRTFALPYVLCISRSDHDSVIIIEYPACIFYTVMSYTCQFWGADNALHMACDSQVGMQLNVDEITARINEACGL